MFACQDHAESELFGEGRLCRIAYSQAARAFGIRSPHTVIMRSRRAMTDPKAGSKACAAVQLRTGRLSCRPNNVAIAMDDDSLKRPPKGADRELARRRFADVVAANLKR